MLDILGAALIARSFGKRAKERGKSRGGVVAVVFLTILGSEIVFGLAFASGSANRGSLVGGILLGWVIGALAATGLGSMMTSGPALRREEPVAGRVCFECETPIVNDWDGEACGGCKHALHLRCMSEHARAHRAFARGASPSGEPTPTAPDDDASPISHPAPSGALAGEHCNECGLEIVMRHQGMRCETCGDPLHRACAAEHKTKHFGPFRASSKRASSNRA